MFLILMAVKMLPVIENKNKKWNKDSIKKLKRRALKMQRFHCQKLADSGVGWHVMREMKAMWP